MRRTAIIPSLPDVDRVILTVRNQKVILDADLAAIYGVSTKRLNEQVKRNEDRFPPDFAFQLTLEEWAALRAEAAGAPDAALGNRSQIATSSPNPMLKSQIAASSFAHGGRRKRPIAFTEHGAIMAANVLSSARAAQMSVFVVRAFVKMRAALTETRELARKLAAVEAELKSRLDVHEAALVEVLQRIMKILDPPPPPPEARPPEIGFHVKEDAVPYRIKRRPVRAGAVKGGAA
jgi:hypothetical protein